MISAQKLLGHRGFFIFKVRSCTINADTELYGEEESIKEEFYSTPLALQ